MSDNQTADYPAYLIKLFGAGLFLMVLGLAAWWFNGLVGSFAFTSGALCFTFSLMRGEAINNVRSKSHD